MRTSFGAWLAELARLEARRLALWTPALFGAGIALYFALAVEPPGPLGPVAALAGAAAVAAGAALGARWAAAALVAAGCVAAGFGAAAWRAQAAAAPVVPGAMTAAVEGTVLAVETAASGRPRLLLGDVWVFGLAPDAMPARARIALRRDADAAGLAPGDRVSALARIGPPGGPVEPGGFDYRRVAWFDRIGAVGVARGPVATIARGEGASGALARLRARLGAALRARLPGETGAFAAALAVGDRAGVPPEALAALRDSNLAHLLAISGLHMALVCGGVFWTVRAALALASGAALRRPIRKWAALAGLAAGAAYLLLSGAGTPTQRAFVMAAAAFGAMLIDRPAVTLRALAAAALVVLAAAPETLAEVGFQMSFAATLALVAAYEAARRRGWLMPTPHRGRRALRWALGLALTSLVAGAATAPFAAHHFNRLTSWGFFANLAAVPALGFWAAPALLAAAVAAPFGLEGPFLQVAGAGIDWILGVARFFAALPAATRPVGPAPAAALALIVLGGLWLGLWRSGLRLAGAGALALGLGLWAAAPPRPATLIAPGGALVGVATAAGRSLDHATAAGYAAETWLRRDADAATQAQAAARPLWRREGDWSEAPLGAGGRISRIAARRAPAAALAARCGEGDVLVAPEMDRARPPGPCLFLDGPRLDALGAVALDPGADAPRMRSARDAAGDRLWTRAPGGLR